MTRVLLADDHPIILSGAAALLRGSAFEIAGTCPNGGSVLAARESLRPDILVLDMQMPGCSGLEVLRLLRARGDEIPVVLLTAAIDRQSATEAIRLGVNGIVLKDTAPEALVNCLAEVSSGRRWLDESVVDRAGIGPSDDQATAMVTLGALSQRERAVVDLVVQGLRNREIAEELGIVEGTVKVHLHKVYDKLGVGSRTELMIFAKDLI